MRNLFKPDSGLMILMTRITDCIFLSLFFFLGCVPIVTMGASLAAMYDAMYQGVYRGEKNTWMRFFQTFRGNWKSGLVPTLVFLAVACGVGYGLIQCWNAAVYERISWGVFAGISLLAMVPVGMLSLLFPMLSRFENSLGNLLKNTVLLSLANLPRILALGILNAAVTLLCIRYVIPVFLLPGLSALIGTLLIEPIFKPYMPEEEAAE